MSVVKLEIGPGEAVNIGNGVTVTLEKKSGQRARLSFDAPRNVKISLGNQESEPVQAGSDFGPSPAAEYGIKI